MNFVLRKDGGAVGAIGRGAPDVLSKAGAFLEHRLGIIVARTSSVGLELSKKNDFSEKLTQGESPKNRRPLPASPKLWASRQLPLSPGDIKLRQYKLGELC